REVVLVERGCIPTFRATAAIGRGRSRTHDVAWAMAGAAMAESLDKIGAIVPLRVLRRIRLERGLVEEQRFPDGGRCAGIEGKTKIVPARRFPHGLNSGHQISIDRIDVGILDLGEVVVGESGVEMIALAVDALLHGTTEGLAGPCSNPSLGIRRDV